MSDIDLFLALLSLYVGSIFAGLACMGQKEKDLATAQMYKGSPSHLLVGVIHLGVGLQQPLFPQGPLTEPVECYDVSE